MKLSQTVRPFILLPMLLGISLVHAQAPQVKSKVKADLNAQPDKEVGVVKMVQGDESSFVALKTKGGNPAIGGIPQADLNWSLNVIGSDKMEEIKHDTPKFVWGVGPVAFETMESFNKQFRVILSKPDPAHGKLLILENVLNPRSLAGKAASLVAELPYDRLGKGADYFKPDMALGFTTTVAQDGKHMLIGLTPNSTVRSAGCPIFALVVDGKMKPLWSNRLNPDASAVRNDIVDTQVDKDGAVWYLVKNTSDPTPKTKDKTGFNFTLYRLDSVGQKAAVMEFSRNDFPQEAGFAILPNGSIVCAGVYSNIAASSSESVGIFRTTLDPKTMKWSDVARNPFDKQMVKKVERLQSNMHLEHIWPKANGDLDVVTVRSGIETHTVSDLSGKKTEKTEWVNGAFHVMELDPSGAPKWYKTVAREMSFANEGPGKAFSIEEAEVLFLFFNDDSGNSEHRKKNEPVDPVDKPKDALMLEFRADGGYKEKVVLQDGSGRGYFDADTVWHMGNGDHGVVGAPDFRKDRTFPVLIELTTDKR